MASSFHLLRLPEKSLDFTLKCMMPNVVLSLSFLSKRTKNAVNLGESPITVIFGRFGLSFEFKIFNTVDARLYPSREPVPVTAWLRLDNYMLFGRGNFQDTSLNIRSLNFTTRDYLLHLMDLYKQSEIDVCGEIKDIFFEKYELRRLLDGIRILKFTSVVYNTLNEVRVSTRAESFETCIMFCSHYCHTVLSGNVFQHDIEAPVFRINRLLQLNSEFIELNQTIFASGDLNVFLKHWILGLTHQNLKFMVTTMETKDIEDVWKGIDYQQQPESKTRTFRIKPQVKYPPRWYKMTETFKGGYDILRIDGTVATVFLFRKNGCNFYFVVWD